MSIEVQNVLKLYGKQKALNNVSFTIPTGEIVGFLGPNGAGKSTMMKILTTYINQNEGQVKVNGFDTLTHGIEVKKSIGYLPEQPPLYKEMTVDEFLSYCAKLHRIEQKEIKETVDLAKARCGLLQTGKRLIANLSKGYQQRVGIAQAILHSPEIIILDEPTVGLDPNQIR